MKLLFDQNLSPSLVMRLADLYPNSNHVYKLGIDRNSDEELRAYARRESFVIVTKDSDFSDLCNLARLSTEGDLDTPNCSTATIESILRQHSADIEALGRDEIIGILTLF